LLKRGIRGRYKILPHGEHDFQKALLKLDLQEEFYGHIIQIEEASNAVWFKLNYDRVGKNVTKYIGSWRDLDPVALDPYIQDYQILKTKRTIAQSRIGTLNSHAYSLRTLNGRLGSDESQFDKICHMNTESIHEIERLVKGLTKEIEQISLESSHIHEQVKAYIKERKF
jgi:hypothetical protein